MPEYCENYKAYMANIPTKGKSAAPIQVPLAGGQFYGNTESKEQFIIHAIPTRVSVGFLLPVFLDLILTLDK